MSFSIRELDKKDYSRAIQFVIDGMNMDWFIKGKFLSYLFGKYMLYSELEKATDTFALYEDDVLRGVLIVEIDGKNKKYKSIFKSIYSRTFEFIEKLAFKNGSVLYDKANEEMLWEYKKNNSPNGHILLFVVEPNSQGKGYGTMLLKEFENLYKGKEVYLYTDNSCNYKFYEQRGYELQNQRDVKLVFDGKSVDLACYLYRKQIV